MRRDIIELDTAISREVADKRVSLSDAEAVRLLLSGGSAVDWHRLAYASAEEVDRHLAMLLLDMTDPDHRERLRYVYNEAVSYLEEHLQLRFPPELRSPDDVRQVFLWASQDERPGGFRRRQMLSCVILKLMHVIHHMESADLKLRTAISEAELLDLAESDLLHKARAMRDSGLPLLSFYGSRKARSSVITKLLAKRDNIATTIFDKLRFRLIMERREDIVPALGWLVNHTFPFNYVIPGQSHNNLIDPQSVLTHLAPEQQKRAQQLQDDPIRTDTAKNEFSGSTYRMFNFIVDYPVRLPRHLIDRPIWELGDSVFVLVEFQLLDQETARLNEEGENAHPRYKQRQHEVVARRLFRGVR